MSAQLFMSRAVRCDRHRATVRTPDRPSFRFCTPAVFSPAVSACHEVTGFDIMSKFRFGCHVLHAVTGRLSAALDVDVMLFM